MFKRLSALLIVCCALTAQAAPDPALVRQLADEDSSVKVAAIQKLTQTADPDTVRIFQAMADNNLYLAGDRAVIIDGDKAAETGKSDPSNCRGLDHGSSTLWRSTVFQPAFLSRS